MEEQHSVTGNSEPNRPNKFNLWAGETSCVTVTTCLILCRFPINKFNFKTMEEENKTNVPSQEAATSATKKEPFVCPVDPAEASLCDACQ